MIPQGHPLTPPTKNPGCLLAPSSISEAPRQTQQSHSMGELAGCAAERSPQSCAEVVCSCASIPQYNFMALPALTLHRSTTHGGVFRSTDSVVDGPREEYHIPL